MAAPGHNVDVPLPYRFYWGFETVASHLLGLREFSDKKKKKGKKKGSKTAGDGDIDVLAGFLSGDKTVKRFQLAMVSPKTNNKKQTYGKQAGTKVCSATSNTSKSSTPKDVVSIKKDSGESTVLDFRVIKNPLLIAAVRKLNCWARFALTCPWTKKGKTVTKLLSTMAEDRTKAFGTRCESWVPKDDEEEKEEEEHTRSPSQASGLKEVEGFSGIDEMEADLIESMGLGDGDIDGKFEFRGVNQDRDVDDDDEDIEEQKPSNKKDDESEDNDSGDTNEDTNSDLEDMDSVEKQVNAVNEDDTSANNESSAGDNSEGDSSEEESSGSDSFGSGTSDDEGSSDSEDSGGPDGGVGKGTNYTDGVSDDGFEDTDVWKLPPQVLSDTLYTPDKVISPSPLLPHSTITGLLDAKISPAHIQRQSKPPGISPSTEPLRAMKVPTPFDRRTSRISKPISPLIPAALRMSNSLTLRPLSPATIAMKRQSIHSPTASGASALSYLDQRRKVALQPISTRAHAVGVQPSTGRSADLPSTNQAFQSFNTASHPSNGSVIIVQPRPPKLITGSSVVLRPETVTT
ncbi:hypothetical protein BJ508DRAFT_315544 [Ascobolus immersus RN42]|uniref:Uncharacterized protein n=1 Tax=Ascobolus immersus RN42 TaxID=1160509 RepID=A0A3N4HAF5_ASCIM|nr:hypothetical protein BJ508DRAFT_315544 [Ascobolus immersus RN42]